MTVHVALFRPAAAPPHATTVDERLAAYQGLQDAAKETLEAIFACETSEDVRAIYHVVKANAEMLAMLVDAAGHRMNELQRRDK